MHSSGADSRKSRPRHPFQLYFMVLLMSALL